MTYAVVRVRGSADIKEPIVDTMEMLGLSRPNNATVVPADPDHEGMLEKVKDYTAYGEVRAGTLEKLLRERGRLDGAGDVTDEAVAERTDHDDLQGFAEAVAGGDARLRDLPDVDPVFRLAPPKGGFASTKRHHTRGGALGYRGDEINALIDRML